MKIGVFLAGFLAGGVCQIDDVIRTCYREFCFWDDVFSSIYLLSCWPTFLLEEFENEA